MTMTLNSVAAPTGPRSRSWHKSLARWPTPTSRVAHEIGHQFLGWESHSTELMAPKIENITSNFTEEDIRTIRLVDKP